MKRPGWERCCEADGFPPVRGGLPNSRLPVYLGKRRILRLYGLWEGVIDIPPPPRPPFDIETFEPIEPPWQAIQEWIPDDEPDLNWYHHPRQASQSDPERFDQSPHGALASRQRESDDDDPGTNWPDQRPTWQAAEIPHGDGRILGLEYP
ncbi:MAG: hypothetical protein NTW21_33395 [Verrucomicrobia bacterium]|nr:hypothetical protein [Verrucomicrobiota bacterium]